MNHLIITIDGTTASGKGTLARRLADRFHMAYLDTGLLYRKVGIEALRAGIAGDDHKSAQILAHEIAQTMKWQDLEDPTLRSHEASNAASTYAAIPGVRKALIDIQRGFAAHPPETVNGHPCKGVVLDGRDTGTAIAPQAQVKFFITADPSVRARRRTADMTARGMDVPYETVLADLIARDTRDAPNTVPAPDAHPIDSSNQSIDDVADYAAAIAADFMRK